MNPNQIRDMAESKRFSIPAMGEYYDDLLYMDAWINNRTKPVQAQSLLCAKIQEREARIRERVAYLAAKRGISDKEMWQQVLSGKADPTSVDDFVD